MQSDDELLAFWWNDTLLATIAKRLERTPKACYQRGKSLGLCSRQDVMGAVSTVAAEMGVDKNTLRRVLSAAAVPTKRAKRDPSGRTRSGRKKTTFSHRLVDRDEARAAVEAWLARDETRHAAAVRLGQTEGWLKTRLVAAGVYVPTYGHRYPAEVISAAVAAYSRHRKIEALGKSQTVAEWAAETGLGVETIGQRLRDGWPAERAVTEARQAGRRARA